jgi:class 3 adenylate cyclase/tetratricopeptide (TPR) repeat protein
VTCLRCRADNSPGRRFCGECGAPLAVPCGSCGFSNEPGIKFCGGCGAPLSAAPTTATPKFESPDSYTPKHLAEKILTSKAALEGERKQVTVLFADLKGSMELLADRDPEEARKILDPVLTLMMEAVHRYEGTVNQVMGDGIMALFGAPLAHEDHAVRACYAALRMQESIGRYADELRRHGLDVQIRVGLNSGEVVVGSIGSDLRMDYTAVGQTTHLAARMEQFARPGTTLITAEVLRLAEGYVAVTPLGPVAVKGLGEPVGVYEVTGAGPVHTRLQALAARQLSRFVGRDGEVEQLRQAFDKAGEGHGQVVAVVGEAGVGKSRLAYEFTHSHRARSWLVVEAGSVSYGKATPYLPVIDLLQAYFQIETRDDQRKIREKVTGKLLTLDRSLEATVPAVLALLDVPVEDPQWEALDPPRRRQRTLDAVKRLLVRESHVQPLLLVFEDLHWIDAESQALLDSLVEILAGTRVLLLVNYRPEYEHRWGGKSYYTQLRITPLKSESADQLLSSLLGSDASLQPLKQLLIERTEGNPFFLEESVRTLIETRALAGERGAYRLTRDVTAIQVAPTVQAVLAARIDRLPSEEKRLLQSAAVLGKDVPFVLLRVIAELSDEELHRSLARLQAAEFLYETSLFPDPQFTFKHALTHDVAYGSLLQDRRCALHTRIVEAVETCYPDRLVEHIEQMAHHAFRGEAWERALIYLRQAGTKAIGRCAYRQAVAYLDQALIALRHLPESREMIEQAIDIRLDLRNAHMPLGEHDRMLQHISAAEPLATTLADRFRLARVLAYMSANFFIARDHHRAIDSAERGLAVTTGLEDFRLETELNLRLALVHQALGDYPRAIDLTRRNIEILTGDRVYQAFTGPLLNATNSRTFLVRSLTATGRFIEAIPLAEEAVRIAEAIDHLNSLVVALWGLGALHLERGALDEAIPVLERDIRLCQVAELPTVLAWAAPCLGLAYALAGRLAEALPLLQQAVEHGAKATGLHAWLIGVTGAGFLLAGQPDEAVTLAERALRFSREGQERGHEAQAVRLFGEIAARRNPPDIEQANHHYRKALSLAEELGMRPLLAHCHLGLGKLCRRTGKRQEAHEHLTTATTMYREMDMRFWLEQAEAALGVVP